MKFFSHARRGRAVCIIGLALMLGACAHTSPRDPLEPFNRGVYKFNDSLDNAVLKPVATAYRNVIPQPVRNGVANFFANIGDVLVAFNNLLQGKMPEAINDLGRVAVNTTLGVFGVMDVATKLGVEKHDEDFGQTLGWWGVGNGAYLVLPFFGPSSLRDGVGLAVDFKLDIVYNSTGYNMLVRNSVSGLRIINRRALLLEGKQLLDESAIDPYVAVRDGYLQRRRSLVYDGKPPPDKDEEEDVLKPRTEIPGDNALAESPRQDAGAIARAIEPDAATPATAPALPLPGIERVRTPDAPAASPAPAAEQQESPPGNAKQVGGPASARLVRVWFPLATQ